MAFGLFLNFEKLSLDIIENEINQMTDDNTLYDTDEDALDEINEEKFLSNLYHGSIAATFIVNLYETTLNTILGRRLGCVEQKILEAHQALKLQIICVLYDVDLASVKGHTSFAILQDIIKVRNDITHFKSNEIFEGTFIPSSIIIPKGTSKRPIAEVFTKTFMEKSYNEVLNFIDMLCQKCDLVMYKDCQALDCDARDALCEFVVEKAVFDQCIKERLGE